MVAARTTSLRALIFLEGLRVKGLETGGFGGLGVKGWGSGSVVKDLAALLLQAVTINDVLRAALEGYRLRWTPFSNSGQLRQYKDFHIIASVITIRGWRPT